MDMRLLAEHFERISLDTEKFGPIPFLTIMKVWPRFIQDMIAVEKKQGDCTDTAFIDLFVAEGHAPLEFAGLICLSMSSDKFNSID